MSLGDYKSMQKEPRRNMNTILSTRNWHNDPISRTCEVHVSQDAQCGKETKHAYQAWCRGWMALCDEHAAEHRNIARPIETLLEDGNALASYIASATPAK